MNPDLKHLRERAKIARDRAALLPGNSYIPAPFPEKPPTVAVKIEAPIVPGRARRSSG